MFLRIKRHIWASRSHRNNGLAEPEPATGRGEWFARRVLVVLATVGVALSVAALPAMARAAASPSIEDLTVSHVTEHDATLEAQIDPSGLETTYAFHMTSYACPDGGCAAIDDWVLPGGSIPAGTGDQTVSLDLNGAGVMLKPGTSYKYAVTASNAVGEAPAGGEWESTQHEFTTLSPPPVIESESASNVTEHDATLQAQIETNDLYTGYWFQIDTNSSYDFTRPNCPFEIGGAGGCESISLGEPLPAGLAEPQPEYIPAGSGNRAISVDLGSIGATLQPGTTYHYRVIASDGGSIVDGPDRTFATPSQSTSPPAEQGTELSSSSGGGGGGGQPAVSPVLLSSPSAVLDLSSPHVPATTKSEATGNAPKLAKALRACEKRPEKQRAICRKQADKRYATTAKKASKKANALDRS